jgi:hypothetical protein
MNAIRRDFYGSNNVPSVLHPVKKCKPLTVKFKRLGYLTGRAQARRCTCRNFGVKEFIFAVFKNEVMIAANSNTACGASLIARKAQNDKKNSCLLANSSVPSRTFQ